MADLQRSKRYARRAFNAPLDESLSPDRNPGLVQAQNVVYRRFGALGKRTGSAVDVGTGSVGPSAPILSGVRWYRGRPSVLAQMIVQCNDTLYVRNDVTGAWTSIGALAAGSTPAFFASAYDPSANSDVLIIAYGSGPPKKWDGTTLSALNASITNNFTGCAFWHEHVWFWGDSANPDTAFATDLGNPESYAFSTNFGGYQIGRGDGDATITCIKPWGGALAIFKNRSIYTITGFDFYQGDYQFAVTPLVSGIGTSNGHSVAVLRNALVWWSGQSFYRMASGDAQPTPLGTPISTTCAVAAQESQAVIRAVAGDFLVQTAGGPQSYSGLYLCAIDTGSAVADTIAVYDDDASQFFGKPAWSKWTGLTVGAFIPWGGPGDQKLLYIGSATGVASVTLLGGSATADGSSTIQVVVRTGRDNAGIDETKKHCSYVYLSAETNQTVFSISIASDIGANTFGTSSETAPPGGTGVATVDTSYVGDGSVVGPVAETSYQTVGAASEPTVDGNNFQFTITEQSATSAYELIALAYLIQEETLVR
jgi:hypothetical protein